MAGGLCRAALPGTQVGTTFPHRHVNKFLNHECWIAGPGAAVLTMRTTADRPRDGQRQPWRERPLRTPAGRISARRPGSLTPCHRHRLPRGAGWWAAKSAARPTRALGEAARTCCSSRRCRRRWRARGLSSIRRSTWAQKTKGGQPAKWRLSPRSSPFAAVLPRLPRCLELC